MMRQQNGPSDVSLASLKQAEQTSLGLQAQSQQTSAFVSPFKPKYLATAVLDSASPSGMKKHAEALFQPASSNEQRAFALPRSVAEKPSEDSPSKNENPLQSPPDEKPTKATPSKSYGRNRHDLPSGQKSTEMLN